jgi:glycerol-3-phosphate dehydrogenase
VRRFSASDLPERADVLIIGGAITGASVARDAALLHLGLTGAGPFHDALTDDARLVIDVLESALRAGGARDQPPGGHRSRA